MLMTVALFALGASGATTARAEIQFGDLVKKAAGKDRAAPPSKGARKGDSKSGAGEQGKPARESRDTAGEAKQPEVGSASEKVDRFIDRNNDGIDDRRQSKVKREEPRPTPTPSEERTQQAPAAAPPDSTSRRPPR